MTLTPRERALTLTGPQVRALVAVRDGLVSNRFDAFGNVFVGPKGIGPILYRKLQEMRLIEDVPGRPSGIAGGHHKQQLTKAGRDVLAAIYGQERT